MTIEDKVPSYLTGRLLVAMPQMEDPRFEHAVVYICGHDVNGSMGLVINKYADTLTLKEILSQLSVHTPNLKRNLRVHFGGPVEMGRGFVLHSTDYLQEGSIRIDDNYALTATVEILRDIAIGKGPEKCLLALGYVSWSPGQIEAELQANSWLEIDSQEKLIFCEELDDCWSKAIGTLGIDPSMLSSDAGHA